MLPNLDVTNTTGLGASSPNPAPARRSETDRLTNEEFRNTQNIREIQSPVKPADSAAQRDAQDVASTPDTNAAEATQQTALTTQPRQRTGTTSIYDRPAARDSAEINFQLTLEERDVFLNAMSGQEDPASMTPEEQTTLQKVSERIEKLLEEAEGKSADRVDRLDKAIKEWYNRLSNGKHKAPADLVRLIRLSALGTGDLSKIE